MRLRKFREALNHFWPKPGSYPVKLIQVAGTSGKGSTCQFLQAGLARYGRAGCYVKPHVFDYAERFVVENRLVEHGELMDVWYGKVRPYVTDLAMADGAAVLGHQETSLLIALHVFEAHGLDWAAVETGIGGRYDPVTVLEVAATVLTNVGRDHEEVLGSEHWQRALEKAGICRMGVPLFLGDDDPRTVEVVGAVCREVGTPLHRVSSADRAALESALRVRPREGDPGLVLGSSHQLQNATLAAKVITTMVPGSEVRQFAMRLLETKYVGRFWQVEEGVYADVAHNPSKTEALSKEVEQRFPGKKKIFVVGVSGTRDAVEVIGPLVGQAKAIVVTSAGYKGQEPESVYSSLRERFPTLPIHLAVKPGGTLKVAKNLRTGGETIVFTGSTYMIDQALNRDERLRHLNGTYGWRERIQPDERPPA